MVAATTAHAKEPPVTRHDAERRKKILEQLILLLLRILLIFLAGLLFARFLGEDPSQGKESRPVLHVVILDDSPSMTDNGAAII